MTAICYIDPIARCVVFSGVRRNSRAFKALIQHAHEHEGAPPDWPVVREGLEHERRHRQVKLASAVDGAGL